MANFKNSRRKKITFIKENNYEKELINEIKYNLRMNRLETALSLIEESLYTNPNNNYVLGYKAMVLFKMGDKQQALLIYRNILKKKDLTKRDELFIMSQYANLLSKSNDKDLAIYYYERVVNESKFVELVARAKLSILYSEFDRYEDALNILNIEGFNNMFLNVKRASIYAIKDDFESALKSLNQKEYNDKNYALNEKFDDEYIIQEKNYLLGHIFYKQGKFNKALPYLSKATSLKNRVLYIKSNIDIARIYIILGRIDDSIKLCEEIKKDCQLDYFSRILDELLAKAYARKNDYENAQKHLNNIETDEKNRNINLGKLELLKGNFEKAEEYFSSLNIQVDDISIFYDEFYRLALVKLRLGKYDEVEEILDLFDSNTQKFEISNMKYEIDRIRTYIDVQRNKDINSDNLKYSRKQIVSYNEKDAINHVIDHHVENARASKFNENINIEELFEDVKNKMTKDNIIYDSLFDKYIIKYRNVGYNLENESIHQLLVLTIPNTKDIITMYPYDGTESVFTLEELEEKPKSKVKRLSQIEKFNMRYRNN